MRRMKTLLALPLLIVGLGQLAPAQVGEQLPEVELTDFGNSEAKDYSDYLGRTVLIEFFAYW